MDIGKAMLSARISLEADRKAKARRMKKHPEPVVVKSTYGNYSLTCLGALEVHRELDGGAWFTHLSANPRRPCGPFLPALLDAEKALTKARKAYAKALKAAHDYGNELKIGDVPEGA